MLSQQKITSGQYKGNDIKQLLICEKERKKEVMFKYFELKAES